VHLHPDFSKFYVHNSNQHQKEAEYFMTTPESRNKRLAVGARGRGGSNSFTE
jgi:hypothetical protein